MVAQLLMRESEPVTGTELESALLTLEQHSVEHRQRRMRGAIAEAERKGDLTGVTALITERMELDRRLRELDLRLRDILAAGMIPPRNHRTVRSPNETKCPGSTSNN